MRFLTRLTLYFIALSALVVSAITLAFYLNVSALKADRTQQELNSRAKLILQTFERELFERSTYLTILAQHRDWTGKHNRTALTRVLSSFKNSLHAFDRVSLVDRNNRVVVDSNGLGIGNSSGALCRDKALASGSAMNFSLQPENHVVEIQFCAATSDHQLLFSRLPLKHIQQKILNHREFPHQTELLDFSGRLLYSSTAPEGPMKTVADWASLQTHHNQALVDPSGTHTWTGAEFIHSLATRSFNADLKFPQVLIHIKTAKSIITSRLKKVALTSLAIGLLAIAVFSFFIIRLAEHLTRPITQLVAAAEAAARSDFEPAIHLPERNDEFGVIFAAYRNSGVQLKDSLEQLKKNNSAIEHLYAEALRSAEGRALLLREINHRVKNNLVSILGLLLAEKLSARKAGHAHTDAVLERLNGRILRLIDVHQMLSETQWAPVPFKALATRILNGVATGAPGGALRFEVVSEEIMISPRQASSIGLILNELATNAAKHRPHPQEPVQIRVEATFDAARVRCVFRDHGLGFPEAVTQKNEYGMGLQLVQQLTCGSLRGTMALRNESGAVVDLLFALEDTATT